MTWTGKFQPPDAPELPPASVSPALNKGTGTRSIGDRLRFWRALAGLLVLLWAVPYGAIKLAGAGLPLADVVWWACGLAVVFGLGVLWVGVTLAQDLAQFLAMLALWRIQLAELIATGDAKRKSLASWNSRWNRAPEEKPPATITAHAQQEAEARRAFLALAEQARSLSDRLTEQEARARVAGQGSGIRDQETQHLVARPPIPPPARVDYIGTDLEALMSVAFSGKAPSLAHFAGAGWSRARYEAARDRLLAAGCLHQPGKGRAIALAPDFARAVAGQGPEARHDLAEAWLAREVPSPAGTVARST